MALITDLKKCRLPLLLFFVFEVAFSCSAVAQEGDKPVIELEGNAASEASENYSFRIYASGVVLFRGSSGVAVIGTRSKRIPSKSVSNLLDMIQQSGLSQRVRAKDIVDRSVTFDASSVRISIYQNGSKLEVDSKGSKGEVVKSVAAQIGKTVGGHDWVHGSDPITNSLYVFDHVDGLWLKHRFSSLMRNAGAGNTRAVNEDVRAGVALNAKDATGWTALSVAASLCREKAVSALLNFGASVNSTDANGDSALTAISASPCYQGQYAKSLIVRTLLESRADPNLSNIYGHTALMLAAKAGSPGAVRLLLAAGAKVDMRDRKGRTALSYANSELQSKQNSRERVIDLCSIVTALSSHEKMSPSAEAICADGSAK